MGLFDNIFTTPSVTKSTKTKELKVLTFSPENPELCASFCETFNKEVNAIEREAVNAIARSFTSGRAANGIPVMDFPQLTYWLQNDCQKPSIKKNWPKIIGWWLSNQGVHVRKESGKVASYKLYLPDGFFPVYFFDFEAEMISAIKEGSAMVFNPIKGILCKADSAEKLLKEKMPSSKPDDDKPTAAKKPKK